MKRRKIMTTHIILDKYRTLKIKTTKKEQYKTRMWSVAGYRYCYMYPKNSAIYKRTRDVNDALHAFDFYGTCGLWVSKYDSTDSKYVVDLSKKYDLTNEQLQKLATALYTFFLANARHKYCVIYYELLQAQR